MSVKNLSRFALILAVCALAVIWWTPKTKPISAGLSLQEALSDKAGVFAEVVPGKPFSFPSDHGEHSDYKTEWWYFTGNLNDSKNHRYGYQLTLFRIGLPKHGSNPSKWSANSLIMGHFAISDVENKTFHNTERLSRSSLDLAGVDPKGPKIWLENWSIVRQEGRHPGWILKASAVGENNEAFAIDLVLQDMKPIVLQGDHGYSKKGPDSRHASYYVSQTRLQTDGVIRLGDQERKVSGESWFDHEWSSEALAEGLVGWDWFSLQLSNQTELMLYLLRYEDGRLEASSSGSLVDKDGTKHNLKLEEFLVKSTKVHTSPKGVEYPSHWSISIPEYELKLEVAPVLPDQEMNGRIPYWEGAVDVSGSKGDANISGRGFVELTGY